MTDSRESEPLITRQSAFNYATTVDRLVRAIIRRSLTIFCRVDHAAGARQAGLSLPAEEVFIFGNPRAGTPLMQVSPAVGYELPLRIVVWQQDASVKLGHADPRDLGGRFSLEDMKVTLDQMATLLNAVSNEAANPTD